MMEKMAAYANENGCASAIPYFSIGGKKSIKAIEWDELRYIWHIPRHCKCLERGPIIRP
jgi:hypothetical protein